MKNKYFIIFLTLIIKPISCSKRNITRSIQNKPNIIYLLTDDLGYGDFSCCGQTYFSTSNIDNLAKQIYNP